ncbi:MAG: hypothetical protein E7390_06975 [Ruminococcaceae bacterium]|nr:hypothetical protein [Oscillospiraceae bacterium]
MKGKTKQFLSEIFMKTERMVIFMKKKYLSIFVASLMLLSLAVCIPASAADEDAVPGIYKYDVDTYVQDSTFTVTGADPELVAETPEGLLNGNGKNMLRIEHSKTSDITTVVFRPSILPDSSSIANMAMAFYWEFYIDTLTLEKENETDPDPGVKLEMGRGADVNSQVFKNTKYKFFRKAMAYNSPSAYGYPSQNLKLTFTGKGVVYLRDVEVEYSDTFLNASFEGCIADGRPGIYGDVKEALNEAAYADWHWRFEGLSGAPVLKSWIRNTNDEAYPSELAKGDDTYNEYAYFVETPQGNYIAFMNCTRGAKMALTFPNLTVGETYELSVDFRTNGKNGVGFTSDYALLQPAGGSAQIWTKEAPKDTWTTATYSVVYGWGNANVARRSWIYIHPHNEARSTDVKPIHFFVDNIKFNKASEKCTLKNEAGEEVSKLVRGEKMTVSFEKPLFKTADSGDVAYKTYCVDGVESKTSVAVVAALYSYDENGIAKIESLKVESELKAKIVTPSGVPYPTSNGAYRVGFTPAQTELTFEVPNNNTNYKVKVFCLDSMVSLKPLTGSPVYEYVL